MPSLEALYRSFRDRPFKVIGISEDEEGWEAVEGFLKLVPVSFPILLDGDMKLSERFGTFRIPETYLIDANGKIADKFVGPQDYNQPVFHQKIERLLTNHP
jgi:peroxiredoxin